MGEPLDIGRGCAIDSDELVWRFEPSGGPGGQHANRSHTRVVLTFDIAASPSLDDVTRARLRRRFGDTVKVVVDESRSQHRNRETARRRLLDRLGEALQPVRTRRPSRPGRGAVERRLADKARRSARKRERGRAATED